MSVSLLCQNVVTSASLSARHSIVVTGTRVVKQPGLSHRGGRGKHIVIPPRAGFLDNLLGVNNGNDGDKKVMRPKPGTKTVLMCSCCGNKGFEKCPGCNGTGKSKVNGNVMERFKCMVCQGMGGISCTNCNRGGKGLTPEQRGER